VVPLGEVDVKFAATQGAIDNTPSAGSSLIRQPCFDRHPPGRVLVPGQRACRSGRLESAPQDEAVRFI